MKKVLIVEDDEWLAEQFTAALATEYTCHMVTNAYDAIELIDHESFDSIVLDIFLAGSNGMTLLHELQSYSDTAQIPVVVCSLAAADTRLADLAPYGVKAILDKQMVNPILLRRAIHEALAA